MLCYLARDNSSVFLGIIPPALRYGGREQSKAKLLRAREDKLKVPAACTFQPRLSSHRSPSRYFVVATILCWCLHGGMGADSERTLTCFQGETLRSRQWWKRCFFNDKIAHRTKLRHGATRTALRRKPWRDEVDW